MLAPKAKSAFFYGWWVVLVCAAVQFLISGTHFYGFTAIFNPIVQEFGWSYAQVSLASTFRGFESGVMAPIVGIFVDKFGPRRLVLSGIAIVGLGFLLFSRVNSLWSFYVVSIVIALGTSLALPVATMTMVAKWFKRRLTLAMGFLTAGFGAGGLLVPLVVWIVDRYTWRASLLIFGIGILVLFLPLVLIVKEPRQEALPTEGEVASSGAGRKSEGLTAKQVLRTKDFWLFSTALLFGTLSTQAIVTHQIPYMVSIGISRQAAGFLAVAFSVANIAGRLAFGWLGDLIDKRRSLLIDVAMVAVGVLGFALSTTVAQFIICLAIFGMGSGGLVPLRPAFQTELFGLKAFGSVQGLLMIFVTTAGMLSPLFAGWVFDLRGDYRPAFLILTVCTAMAVPVVLAIHKKA